MIHECNRCGGIYECGRECEGPVRRGWCPTCAAPYLDENDEPKIFREIGAVKVNNPLPPNPEDYLGTMDLDGVRRE